MINDTHPAEHNHSHKLLAFTTVFDYGTFLITITQRKNNIAHVVVWSPSKEQWQTNLMEIWFSITRQKWTHTPILESFSSESNQLMAIFTTFLSHLCFWFTNLSAITKRGAPQ